MFKKLVENIINAIIGPLINLIRGILGGIIRIK